MTLSGVRGAFSNFEKNMIPISKALKIIAEQIVQLSSEKVSLDSVCGRVLAEDIFADSDLPPFDRSQMDGFAVRTRDVANAPVTLKIIGESVAGKGFDEKLKSGEAVRIMTGARLPLGADSVQKKELTRESEDGFVEIFEPTKIGQNFVEKAAEITNGTLVFSKGELINAQMLAVLASFGYAKVKVFKQPKVSILATGSEIIDVSKTPKRDQIRDSNSISLKTFAERAGAEVEILPRVKDDLENLTNKIAEFAGIKKKFKTKNLKPKILVLSGGVSVGDYDFTKPALRELGAEIFFERVSLRPGKPTVFAKLNNCLIFGLPGNPVSVAVTFFLFVRAAILRMQGAENCDLPSGVAFLTKALKGAKERDSYIPAKMSFSGQAHVSVEPLRWSGSSDFVSFSRANCLIFVPQGAEFEAARLVNIVVLP